MKIKTTLNKSQHIQNGLSGKKLSEIFLFNAIIIGDIIDAVRGVMMNDTYNIYYFFGIPVIFSVLSIIIYILVWKAEAKKKYIATALLLDAVIIIIMVYFLQTL